MYQNLSSFTVTPLPQIPPNHHAQIYQDPSLPIPPELPPQIYQDPSLPIPSELPPQIYQDPFLPIPPEPTPIKSKLPDSTSSVRSVPPAAEMSLEQE